MPLQDAKISFEASHSPNAPLGPQGTIPFFGRICGRKSWFQKAPAFLSEYFDLQKSLMHIAQVPAVERYFFFKKASYTLPTTYPCVNMAGWLESAWGLSPSPRESDFVLLVSLARHDVASFSSSSYTYRTSFSS